LFQGAILLEVVIRADYQEKEEKGKAKAESPEKEKAESLEKEKAESPG
jgi:hypothetical protein